jgi:hypothetical protein
MRDRFAGRRASRLTMANGQRKWPSSLHQDRSPLEAEAQVKAGEWPGRGGGAAAAGASIRPSGARWLLNGVVAKGNLMRE